jgi:hypothetical protein
MSKRQLFGAPLLGIPAERVDFEKGVIYGAAVTRVGPAKGHGVQLDSDFINNVASMGNAQGAAGLKVRFGHPTMSGNALMDAPFIGRAKNFTSDGQTVRADIFLSNSAKETPAGNLHQRAMELSADSPDMFGMSIVFSAGEMFREDKDGNKFTESDDEFRQLTGDPFATIEKLFGVDVVDDPAATDGMFSAIQPEAFAVQASDFLDNHPKIWDLIISSPDIVAEFTARHEAMVEMRTKTDKKEETIMEDNQTIVEPVVAHEAAPVTETAAAEVATVVNVQLDTAEKPMEFKALFDAYGGELATEFFNAEFTADQAKDAYIAHLQNALGNTSAQLEAAAIGEDEPAEFAAEATPVDADKASRDAHAQALTRKGVSPGVARFAASLNINEKE